MAVFASLQRVASWYGNETKRPERRPSEQETVCYLVVPLLLSLGWSQQTAAVQWHYVDVALFSGMPPTEATLACVVEAKLQRQQIVRVDADESIDSSDAWVAAAALHYDVPLVTHNRSDYLGVAKLKLV